MLVKKIAIQTHDSQIFFPSTKKAFPDQLVADRVALVRRWWHTSRLATLGTYYIIIQDWHYRTFRYYLIKRMYHLILVLCTCFNSFYSLNESIGSQLSLACKCDELFVLFHFCDQASGIRLKQCRFEYVFAQGCQESGTISAKLCYILLCQDEQVCPRAGIA